MGNLRVVQRIYYSFPLDYSLARLNHNASDVEKISTNTQVSLVNSLQLARVAKEQNVPHSLSISSFASSFKMRG